MASAHAVGGNLGRRLVSAAVAGQRNCAKGRFVMCALATVLRCVGRFHQRAFAESAFCVEVSDRRALRLAFLVLSGRLCDA
jgi:hypothetical protein